MHGILQHRNHLPTIYSDIICRQPYLAPWFQSKISMFAWASSHSVQFAFKHSVFTSIRKSSPSTAGIPPNRRSFPSKAKALSLPCSGPREPPFRFVYIYKGLHNIPTLKVTVNFKGIVGLISVGVHEESFTSFDVSLDGKGSPDLPGIEELGVPRTRTLWWLMVVRLSIQAQRWTIKITCKCLNSWNAWSVFAV